MAASRLTILTLFLSASFVLADVKSCYYGSGNQLDNSEFMPCNDNDQSSCCYVGSYCLADGACWDPTSQMTYIAGCTDENYSDPSCAAQSCSNKNSPIQGIAHACGGSDWYCCSGTGQQADKPQTTSNDTCPCDSANGEAVSEQSSLNPTASLPGDFNGQIAIFTTDSSGNSVTSNIDIPTEGPTTSSGAPTSTTDPSTITSSAASTTTSSGASTITNNNDGHTVSATPGGAPVSTSSSASPSSTPGTTSSSSNSMKLGLGIGLPLAALALAGVITFAALLYRRRRQRRHADPYAYSGIGPGLGGDDRSTAVWQGDVSSHGATPAVAEKAHFGHGAYSDSPSPNLNIPSQGYTAYGGGHSRADSSTSNGYGGGRSGHTPTGSVSAVSGPTSPPRGAMSELSSENGWTPSHELGGSPIGRGR